MPTKKTKSHAKSRTKHPTSDRQASQEARRDREKRKSSSTQAGNYVHEEMEHYKTGKGAHGKRPIKNRKQAIAIGLSKARKHGIRVGKKKKAA